MGRLPFSRSVAAVLIAVSLAACGPKGPVEPPHTAPTGLVADDAFPAEVHALLGMDPNDPQRPRELAVVTTKQIARASNRFKQRDPEGGLTALAGALSLVRAGEFQKALLGAEGATVLDAAAREYAKRGDEGRAEASYRMLLQISPEAEDAKSHLAALGAWGASGTSPLLIAGEKARSTQTRQLLEPTAEAHTDAEKSTLRWLDEAFLLRDRHRKMQGAPTQPEASEALRAFQTGPSLLAAIHLRSANAAAAKAALELPNVHPLVREDLMKLIEKVAKDPTAEAWLDLSRALRPADGDDDGESAPILRAASFAAAAEAYRLDPTEPSAALTTAIWLSDIGMADAAPGVLVAAVKKVQDPRFVSLALNVAFDGMVAALEHEDPAQARLIYKEAAPLLEVARKKEFAGKLRPSPAALDGTLADAYLREADLDHAFETLTKVAKSEPSSAAFVNLARVEEHRRHPDVAAGHLDAAIAAAEGPLARAEILTLRGALERRRNRSDAATTAFAQALEVLSKARAATSPEERARAERMIGTVYDEAGAPAKAAAAYLRAIDAGARDKRVQGALIGSAVARAYLAHDEAAAHRALDKGLAFDLEETDLVYAALWANALEKDAKTAESDAVKRVLGKAESDPRWVGALARFARGKLDAAALAPLAQTPAQRAEALFYTAVAAKGRGEAAKAEEGFRAVVATGAIELMEYQLSRDFLDATRSNFHAKLPEYGLP